MKLESIRVGVEAHSLWRNIDRLQELTDESGSGMTLSFCLMPQNWQELVPFLHEADRRGVNCNVVLVNQPDEYDLFKLPLDQINDIRAELSAEPVRFTNEPAQREWANVYARIVEQLQHPATLSVSVPNGMIGQLHYSRRATTPAQRDQLLRELRESSGVDPLTVSLVDDVVREVVDPAWAEWLESHGWIGLAEREIETQIAARPNTSLRVERLADVDEFAERYRLDIDVDDVTTQLLLCITVDVKKRDVWLFLVPFDTIDAVQAD